MGKEKITTDQRPAAVTPPANEFRKGVNVLTTSDPRNPAANPFVQQQKQSPKDSSNGSKGSGS